MNWVKERDSSCATKTLVVAGRGPQSPSALVHLSPGSVRGSDQAVCLADDNSHDFSRLSGYLVFTSAPVMFYSVVIKFSTVMLRLERFLKSFDSASCKLSFKILLNFSIT